MILNGIKKRCVTTITYFILTISIIQAQVGLSGGAGVVANFSTPVGMDLFEIGERTGTGGVWGAINYEMSAHTKYVSATTGIGIWMIGFTQNGFVLKYGDQLDSVLITPFPVVAEYKYFFIPFKLNLPVYSADLYTNTRFRTGVETQFLLKWLYNVRFQSGTTSSYGGTGNIHEIRGSSQLRSNRYKTLVNSAGGGVYAELLSGRIKPKIGFGCLVDLNPAVNAVEPLTFRFVHPYIDVSLHYMFILHKPDKSSEDQ